MADLKITSLPALAEGSIQATDALAVADLSATETKKVTVKDLVAAAVTLLDAGDIPASKVGTLGTDQVATGAIVDGAVTNVKLANSSISIGGVSIALGATDATPSFNLQDATGYETSNLNGTITNAQLAGSISGDKLAAGAIPYAKLNITDGDIPGAKITGNSITNAQIGANAVGASELADDAVDTAAIVDSAVTNVKLANSSVSLGGVSIALGATDATPAFNLTDATNYPTSSLSGTITNAQLAGSITGDKLANTTVTYAKLNISDGDIAGAKITGNSVTAAQIAANAVTASELADDSVDTAAVVDGAITGSKIASTTIAASNIVDNTITATQIANGAIGTNQIVDGAVTAAKLSGTLAATSIANDAVTTTKILDDAVTSAKIAANAITASELANNAVDTAAVLDAAITNDKVATGISGTKIGDGTITPAKLNTSNLDRSLNVASGNLGINNAVTGGASTRSGITYNAQGLITATAALAAADLPVATTSAVGGISVGAGLSVTGAGALSVSNSVTAVTGAVKVNYNAQGAITGSASLIASDLPTATTSAKGAVQITSGGGLTVDGSGNLSTSTSGVSAGTYQSVTVDAKGVVTAGAGLTATLVPDLPAAKITSGSLDAARIANDSIDGSKLSNTSTAIFQSIAQSGYPTAEFNGQILFDTVSEDAFIWDGNAWQAITTLTKGSLVFGGTYNAGTSQMVATTSAGIAAGLSVGSNLPTASATTDGVYVVVSSSGTPQSPAPAIAFAPPDYILGVTNSAGSTWNEVDLSQTVAGQVASNITFTPYGQVSATNVQDAIQELETEKLALSGGTVTGQLLIGNAGSLVFEGATVDAYETTLTVTDPTLSDKTITFPDITGTVITSGDTNTVTSTMVDGSLVNANLAAGAAIAFSKLAALTSAQIIVGNGSNVPTAVAVTGDIGIDNAGLTSITAGVIVDADISGSAAITGSKIATGTTSAVGVLQLTDSATSTSATTAATPAAVKIAKDAADAAATTANAAVAKTGDTMTGHLVIDNGKELRLSESDSDGANYTGLKVQAQTGDITLTLPAVAPTANQVLKADASTPTTLTWATDAATDSTKMPLTGGTFTGDVTFTGDSSNGLWDKSASVFVANLTGNVTGNLTGDVTGDLTGNADTVTVTADNGTDSTHYPLFAGAASGNLAGETDSGFTYNPSSGYLTATRFIGRLQGSAGQVTASANNTTDETVYLTFVDGATGDQDIETDTGLTYNPSTGLLTSTGFSGAGTSLTALNASNLSSGTVDVARLGTGTSVTTKFLRGDNTWQTISATPEGTAILSTGESGGTKFLREDGDGTCSWQAVPSGTTINNNADNRLITGSGTANTLEGESGLTFDGSTLTVTGAATVSGVATVGGLVLDDGDIAKFGAESDLQIYHENSSHTTRLEANKNRTIDICYKVASGTYGGLNRHMIQCTPGSGPLLYYATDSLSTLKLSVTNLGITVAGTTTTTGVDLGDDNSIQWGANDDLIITHNSSTNKNRIICYNARPLHVERYDGTDFEDMITATPDGAVSLFFAGASKLTTSNTGVSIAGNCNITGGGVTLNDNHGYYSGGTNDLALIHDGSNSYLRHGGEGDLFVETTGTDEDITIKSARDVWIQTNVNSTAGGGVDNAAKFTHNGAATLYFNNDPKFATSNTGVTITGVAVATSFTGDLTGNAATATTAGTVTTAAQSAITSVGTLTGLTVSGNISMSGTGAIDVAAGSTAQRPSSASTGMFRYNTTDGAFEGYTGSGWGAIGGGGGTTYTAITSNTTATAGSNYLTNTTSAAFTVTLPASPSAGDTVVVADAGGTWATNNLSVARNGQNIMGSATNLTCNVNGAVVSLIYSGVTANGWIATPN